MPVASSPPLTLPQLKAFWRRSLQRCWQAWWLVLPGVLGRSGLEIGGPSGFFRSSGLLPIYRFVGRLDNLTFAARTVWQASAQATMTDGSPYRPVGRQATGSQFIGEATELTRESDNSRDFVLASHVIEHVANPLRALREWLRITKPGGRMVLVIPHRDGTFDHQRPVTELEHLRHDERVRVAESDSTHFTEIFCLHDLSRDPAAGSHEEFMQRTSSNFFNRCIHHHVFDTALALRMVAEAGWRIRSVQLRRPYHILIVCSKPQAGAPLDNRCVLAQNASWRRRSPFPTDRLA